MTNFRVGCVAALVLGTAVVLSSCSRSPTDAAVDAANAAGRKLMEPLVQKDASAQAERMVAFLADNPACEIYKARMREAGRGSPYEATT
jgi:PBP1b-binding outer membrane lipoprotein LpoB